MNILAQRMRELREERHIRQEDAAAALGLSMSSYCRYEYGKREPVAHVIAGLAQYYGVSADYLLGLKDDRT